MRSAPDDCARLAPSAHASFNPCPVHMPSRQAYETLRHVAVDAESRAALRRRYPDLVALAVRALSSTSGGGPLGGADAAGHGRAAESARSTVRVALQDAADAHDVALFESAARTLGSIGATAEQLVLRYGVALALLSVRARASSDPRVQGARGSRAIVPSPD